ncbi:hypothetical protein DBR40_07165 [Pedobacter sp. KBW01]|uniref:hypothetical protein n=1 Tax=Pedobacter sp. KBW01 TaxID=2153364 RepID=UPI000F598602|nr:hypothetical protein [Pedobacter sp. KBW01]RQO77747.1 hypothetical protein DBR40_07165 [Pedobacter sp. KBW01]
MPTKEEVTRKVTTEVAKEAGISPDRVKEEHVLADYPIYLDKVALGMLTLTLRKYIKTYRSDQTIVVKEVRKSGLTVKSLIELIYEKLK